MKKFILILVIVAFVLGLTYIFVIYHPVLTQPQAVVVPEKPSSPVLNSNVQDLKLEAESVMSMWVNSDGSQEKILFEKNPSEQILMASLTKLMTADVVLENYNLFDNVTISSEAVTEGGYFKAGDVVTVKDLLSTMLMGQDNIAAYALSEKIGPDKFVALMNQKAKDLGLSSTYYANSVGSKLANHTTANDLKMLVKWLLKNQPQIFAISIMPEYKIYDSKGTLRHIVKNADVLLADHSISWADQIIGSKLANNETAGQCILVVLKSPDNNGYVINIILKSKDRFGEMKNFVNWVLESYSWSH